jgi:signal transduction histidine kinase
VTINLRARAGLTLWQLSAAPGQSWSEPSAVLRYAIAVLSVAIALVAALLVVTFLQTEPFVSLFLCAIMFAAWFGGIGPWLFATGLSLFYYYLVPPINLFTVKYNSFGVELKDLPRIILFSIAALFVNLLSAAQRDTAGSLRRSNQELLAAIEDQKRAEAALQHSEMYLTEAQRLSHTGSFGWNVSSGEVIWSEETFRILEYDRAIKPTLGLALQRVHPDDRLVVGSIVDHASRESKDFDYGYRLLMPDGSVRHVHIVGHPVAGQGGQFELIGALMDVTAAKRAEEALQRAHSELAHVTRVTALGELTASIAHEVNQPLAGVIANAEACIGWLDRESPNLDAARSSLESIIADGNRASEVIRHVRLLATKSRTSKALININDVIKEAIDLVRRELHSHGVSPRTELASGLPTLFADRVQLQQVIINLAINGIEAMQAVMDRSRELVIKTHLDEAHQVQVTVSDYGVGIPAENAGRLFNAFFTTKSNGMGMGLSIGRYIIAAHGGRLWATPNLPQGAAFHFTLPLNQEDAL